MLACAGCSNPGDQGSNCMMAETSWHAGFSTCFVHRFSDSLCGSMQAQKARLTGGARW